MRNPKNNRVHLAACLLMVALGGIAFAEEPEASVTHFVDTSTDRVPALTAFPKYPSIARRDRIEGEATVCFKIKANGKISRPVVSDYTHKIFAKPALRAIKKSTFEPLGPGQILATARTCRTYRFRLDPIPREDQPVSP
jgi:TonB family protein